MILKKHILEEDFILLLRGKIIYDYNTHITDMPCEIFDEIQKFLLNRDMIEMINYQDDIDDSYTISENPNCNLYLFHRPIDDEGLKFNEFEIKVRKDYHCWHFIMEDTFNTYVMGLKI